MDNVQRLVLEFLTREGGGWQWDSEEGKLDSHDHWLMAVAVVPYDVQRDGFSEYEGEEGLIPTHTCRLVARSEWYPSAYGDNMLSLVDGDDIYLIVDEEAGTVTSIWEERWFGNQPDYYGGPIGPAYDWVAELGEVFHLQVGNPFKGDRDSHLTIESERAKWDEYERQENERYAQGCDICGDNKDGLVQYGDGRQYCHKHDPDKD